MLLSSLLAMALLMIAPASSQPRVDIGPGPLVGRSADGVDSYKGVPYAAPPVGPLRWRPPQPATPWTVPRDAGGVGAICIQPRPTATTASGLRR
jgi:para-nitrobenzyl esterase